MRLPKKTILLRPAFLFVSCCLVALFSLPAMAQQSSPSANDIATLKEEVKGLKQTQQQILDKLDELKRILKPEPPTIKAPAQMSIQGESFRGDPAAKIAIIEYADFECPFCGRYKHETYPQIVDNYVKVGTVKYFYRDFPLGFHENALPAARAARCAGEQGKFWEMHDSIFADQKAITNKDILDRAKALGIDNDKLKECMASTRYVDQINKDIADAAKMEIGGTPTFLIGTIEPDGNVAIKKTIVGAYPYDAFKSAFDELLNGEAPKAK